MPVVPTVNSVMIDCLDAVRLAGFWSELLGVGVRHVEHGFIWLDPQREGGYSLAFQAVSDPTPGKNKLHLDAACNDLEALTARVEALGGRLVEDQQVPGFVWNVYADPEGNLFCAGHPAD
jgi:predicted enzyme related to lactoylglutathione lyase